VIAAPWLAQPVEDRALAYAIASLVPDHLAEVKRRRLAEIDKVDREVRARLTREINFWDARAARLREEERAGKEQRLNAANAEATAQRMVERLHKRQSELDRERQITALPPVLKGAALVIPRGLLQFAVMAYERALGNLPRDVSAEKRVGTLRATISICASSRSRDATPTPAM